MITQAAEFYWAVLTKTIGVGFTGSWGVVQTVVTGVCGMRMKFYELSLLILHWSKTPHSFFTMQ
jgi:hypothetical protein